MLDLSRLNEKQREAVETLDGPVLIVAGPGTGKTTVLTYRIAHILSTTDTKPESILAMTFTEAGVYAMRKKLYELIGPDAYAVNVTTIHGFCNDVIQQYSEYFPQLNGATPLNDIERIRFTQEILEKTQYANLAPVNAQDFFILDILSIVSVMKREYITEERLEQAIHSEEIYLTTIEKFTTRGPNKGKTVRAEYEQQEKKIVKYKELLAFYKEYQCYISDRKRYDYEDMILYVIDELNKNEELRSILQEKYQYLLVDEYQDTNDAQNALIFALAAYWGDEANIFVVGDDDQAIYRFQGASVKNIEEYVRRYPTAKIITLVDNYRSQQHILDSSREFVRHNSQSLERTLGTIDKSLVSHAAHPKKKIRYAHFHRGEAENLFIADTVEKLAKKKVRYEDMAILVRTNADMNPIVDMLQRKHIPYVRKAGDNALDNYFMKQLLDIVRLVDKIGTKEVNDLLLLKVLHYPYFAIPRVDLLKLARAYPEQRIETLWEYMIGNTKQLDLGVLGITEEGKAKFLAFFDLLISWNTRSFQESLTKILEIIMHESGFLNHVLAHEHKIKHLNALNSFFAEVKSLNASQPDMSVSDFLNAIDVMIQFNLPVKEKQLEVSETGVQIMTAHSSKGLEFSYVFIPQLYTTKWDHRRKIAKISLPPTLLSANRESDELEEDRRLLYVALTRAKQKVYLSFSDIYASTYGPEKEVHRSQFIDEIPQEFVKEINVAKYTAMMQEHIADLLSKTAFNTVYINSIDERDVIKSIVSHFELHPTGLNNYLECPMKFLLTNLLRVPTALSPSLAYGNAYHLALEKLYRTAKLGQGTIPLTDFVDTFQRKLQTYPLRTFQREKLFDKGKKNLSHYYETYVPQLVVPVRTEHKLLGVIGGAHVKGRVDRIDYVDTTKKFIKVLDYKTGHSIPKSAFEGLHPTATIDENQKEKAKIQRYFHQLLFYKVLADVDRWITGNLAEVVSGGLLFVDPERGQFEERMIVYDQSDVEDMKELIITTWQKIQQLEFNRIHERGCEYCDVGR